jgi:beta-phosphoglucomutase-like phosphatase (HAD superfamily)
MTYLGIIFDFNGVLWWDNQLQEQAWREFAMEQFGITLTGEIMETEMHGRNNRHTLEFLAGTPLDVHRVEQFSGQKEKRYRALCLAQGDGFRLSSGAFDLLDALSADEIPRTIATASGKVNLQFFIEHLHLERWFDPNLILFDDGVRPGKPAPDIYLQAAQMIGLLPRDCVVVEDSLAGLQAARAAGIGYIIVLKSGCKGTAPSKTGGADLRIESLAQVPREELFYNPAAQDGAVDDAGHQN